MKNHDTHLQSTNSLDTNSYKFDENGNLLIGTIDDILNDDNFLEKSEELSKININFEDNFKTNRMNSLVSLYSNLDNYFTINPANKNEKNINLERNNKIMKENNLKNKENKEIINNNINYEKELNKEKENFYDKKEDDNDLQEKRSHTNKENNYHIINNNEEQNVIESKNKNLEKNNNINLTNKENKIENGNINGNINENDINKEKEENEKVKNEDNNNEIENNIKNNIIKISSNEIEVKLNGEKSKTSKNKNLRKKRIIELNVNMEFIPKNNFHKKKKDLIEYIKKELEIINFEPNNNNINKSLQNLHIEKNEIFLKSQDKLINNNKRNKISEQIIVSKYDNELKIEEKDKKKNNSKIKENYNKKENKNKEEGINQNKKEEQMEEINKSSIEGKNIMKEIKGIKGKINFKDIKNSIENLKKEEYIFFNKNKSNIIGNEKEKENFYKNRYIKTEDSFIGKKLQNNDKSKQNTNNTYNKGKNIKNDTYKKIKEINDNIDKIENKIENNEIKKDNNCNNTINNILDNVDNNINSYNNKNSNNQNKDLNKDNESNHDNNKDKIMDNKEKIKDKNIDENNYNQNEIIEKNIMKKDHNENNENNEKYNKDNGANKNEEINLKEINSKYNNINKEQIIIDKNFNNISNNKNITNEDENNKNNYENNSSKSYNIDILNKKEIFNQKIKQDTNNVITFKENNIKYNLLPKKKRLYITKKYINIKKTNKKIITNYINLPISSNSYYSKYNLIISKFPPIKKSIINNFYFCTKQKINKEKNKDLDNNNYIKTKINNTLTAITKSKINNKKNTYEFDLNNISHISKNESKQFKNRLENNDKINKEELFSFDSSIAFKEYETTKNNKLNSPYKLNNFISLSNEKNNSKEKNSLSDLFLNKKNTTSNFRKLKIKKINLINKNKIRKNTPLPSFNTNLNFITEKKNEKSLRLNNQIGKLGLPILNINNNILLNLKNSVFSNNIRPLSLSPRITNGYKRHYGKEEKCPICIAMTMKNKYLKSKKQIIFDNDKEKINEIVRLKNLNNYIKNYKRKKNMKNYKLKYLK